MTKNVVRFDADVTLADMRVVSSSDGQCLMIYCRDRVVALFSTMGCDVDAFEFGDSERVHAMELLDRLAIAEEPMAGAG